MDGKFRELKESLEKLKNNALNNKNLQQSYKDYILELVDFAIKRINSTNPNLIIWQNVINNLKNAILKLNSAVNSSNYQWIHQYGYNFIKLLNELPVIDTEKVELSNYIETLETEFKIKIEELQKRSEELNNLIQQIKGKAKYQEDELAKIKSEFDKTIKELFENYSIKAKEMLNEIENIKIGAKKLSEVIGNKGQSEKFRETADYHRQQANRWRIFAIILMIIASVSLIFTLWHFTINEFEWYNAIIRVLAISALFYPATYAAKESSKHRILENANRKLELELASINPFIERLNEQDKNEIRKKMAERYFGNNSLNVTTDSKIESKETLLPMNDFERLFKLFIDFLKVSK